MQQSSSSPHQLPNQCSPEFYAAYLAALAQPLPTPEIQFDPSISTNSLTTDAWALAAMQLATAYPFPFDYPLQGTPGMQPCVLSTLHAASRNTSAQIGSFSLDLSINSPTPADKTSSKISETSLKPREEKSNLEESNKTGVEQHYESVSSNQKLESHSDPVVATAPMPPPEMSAGAADNSALSSSHAKPRTSYMLRQGRV